MGGGGSAPKPDKQMGEAALASAATGQEFLDFMKSQSDVTNAWATEDRARYRDTFEPLQDEFIRKSQEGPDYSDVQTKIGMSKADVRREFDSAQAQMERRNAAMGVSPNSGRSTEAVRRSGLTEALAVAGAGNATRLTEMARADAEADQMEANAINLGSGLAVNPATSIGLSNSGMASGASGAMQGYGQQASILNTDHQNRMQTWQANQDSQNSLLGGLGSVAGFAITNPGMFALSSEEYKEDRAPARGVLDVVRGMDVDTYRYKDGIADGGAQQHVGPMAEDFKTATGKGDGRTIPLQDLAGLTLAAVKELDQKVDAMAQGRGVLGAAA